MNRLIYCLLIGIAAGSSVDRLRYLHDRLVECLPSISGEAPLDPGKRDELIMSGLRFVRNEGERELDSFIDTLMTARNAKIGREGLDDMRWAIMDCLLSEKSPVAKPCTEKIGSQEASAPVERIEIKQESPAVEIKVVSSPVADAKAEVSRAPILVSESRGTKRSRSESEEYIRDELHKVCKSYQNPSRALHVNTRYLAKQHREMVVRGDWNALETRYKLLSYAKAFNLDYLFCDAYRVLQSEIQFLSITETEAKAVEGSVMKRSWSDRAFIAYLENLANRSVENVGSGDRLRVSDMLYSDAKQGRLDLLQDKVNVLDAAGVNWKKIGTLVKQALWHLKQQHY